MNENKVTFHYAHYTRDFRKREVLVQDGTLFMEFRPYDIVNLKTHVNSQLENIFLRVLSRFEIIQRPTFNYSPFGSCYFSPCGFYECSRDKCYNLNRVWHKELGRKGEGDFIRITATFPPAIQERYAGEWNNYQDYLSTI